MVINPYADLMTARYEGVLPNWNEERLVWTVKETETHYIEVMPLMYTAAIITTPKAHPNGYDDRWCYKSPTAAWLAAVSWSPEATPEPEGWHRHPTTGRRRPDGDATKEYINP